MATIKLYLDTRENTGDGTLKIMISHRSSSTTHSLGLKIPTKCFELCNFFKALFYKKF